MAQRVAAIDGGRSPWPVLAPAVVVGAVLVAAILGVAPDTRLFYAVSLAAPLTWIVATVAVGGWTTGRQAPARLVAMGAVTGTATFAVFAALHRLLRDAPVVGAAMDEVLARANAAPAAAVLAIAVLNGVGEELFFRGALWNGLRRWRAGRRHPVVVTTAAYVAVTTVTANPALMAAAAVMGLAFGLLRAATGGVLAPVVTHAVWSALMVLVVAPTH